MFVVIFFYSRVKTKIRRLFTRPSFSAKAKQMLIIPTLLKWPGCMFECVLNKWAKKNKQSNNNNKKSIFPKLVLKIYILNRLRGRKSIINNSQRCKKAN